MARVTVEDCIRKIPNRYELIILASKRARQLLKGEKPLVETDNREIVPALREIAASCRIFEGSLFLTFEWHILISDDPHRKFKANSK